MSKIKLFVNNPEMWEAFKEEVNALIAIEQRSLNRLVDIPDIYRAQGVIKAYNKMLNLRDTANANKG